MFRKNRVYLDWAAATPLSVKARTAMRPWLRQEYGNPSALHQEGVVARRAIDEARLLSARILGVRPNEVFFTGSGTEANNLAIYGLVQQLAESGTAYSEMEIITTAIEHPSVTRVLEYLKKRGVRVHVAPLDNNGVILIEEFVKLLNKRVVLITYAYVNSEIGTIQPVKQLTRLVKKYNQDNQTNIKVHLDAAQAPLWLPCQVHQLGVDMMTLDAGKFCGPKGVGILIKLSGTDLKGILWGGKQEAGLRAGTENVSGIVGASVALEEAQSSWLSRSEKTSAVRNQALTYLSQELPLAIINGALGEARVANNINLSVPGIDTEYLAIWLDTKGFAVSTKSACSGAGGGESAVVKEISQDTARAKATLRISIGPDTTVKNLKAVVSEIKKHLQVR